MFISEVTTMFDSTMLKATLDMFIFLAAELSILYIIIAYAIGVLQEYITPAKIQSILSSKNGKGYVIAGVLGSITPFCSCSTIPFLKGLLKAKAGFGPMLTFLFASPLLNPIIIGLFFVTFGVQVTVFYFTIALIVSVFSGYILEKMGFEKYVKDSAYATDTQASSCCSNTKTELKALQPLEPKPSSSCCSNEKASGKSLTELQPKMSVSQVSEEVSPCCSSSSTKKSTNKWMRIWYATWEDFKRVLPYLMIGVTLGSLIYGFMPTEFITKVANENNPFAIPVAAIIGIPLYIRAEAVIPLSAALAAKGMGLGAVMALIIGSAGASLTEVILLKAIFKNQMIIAFLTVILGMAISAGFIYQWVF